MPSGKRRVVELSSSRGCLDGVARDHHVSGALSLLDRTLEVAHAGRPACPVVDLDGADHSVGTHLDAVGERVREVGDEWRGLGVDFATLQAEAAVDAVLAMSEATVGDGHRPDPGLDARGESTALEDFAVAAHRVGVVGVSVRVAPRPVVTGDGQLALDQLVIFLEVVVADRPVGADTVGGEGVEVAGMEAWGVAGVVDHGSADASAGVVRPERDRVLPADHPRIGPEEPMGPGFVGDPVLVRLPPRAGVDQHHAPAGTGQALGQHGAARAGADDDDVDDLLGGIVAHLRSQLMVLTLLAGGYQPGRRVPAPDLVGRAVVVVEPVPYAAEWMADRAEASRSGL